MVVPKVQRYELLYCSTTDIVYCTTSLLSPSPRHEFLRGKKGNEQVTGMATKPIPPAFDDAAITASAIHTSNGISSVSATVSSSPWESDESQMNCTNCGFEFSHANRRHHCRMCGKLFCQKCSSQRALIPPSSIVLFPPQSAKKSSFAPKEDAQLSILFRTITSSKPEASSIATDTSTTQRQRHQQQKPGMVRDTMMYYAKNLEERTKLAHEPLRVCDACYVNLQPFQEELRATNSNAVRFNTIDPTSCQRLLNSPLAFTLGHEIRKAAYTLNNWLPLPKRSSILSTTPYSGTPHQQQQQQQLCTQISPNLSDIDGIRIPARLLSHARGIAVVTILKGGFGLGVEFGTGLVVARLDDAYSTCPSQPQWSAPSAIGIAGVSWGALIGAQVSDVILLLMTEQSVRIFCNSGISENGNGTVQLGADIGIAVGPIGRSLEGSLSIAPNHPISPIYTYSSSKGLYAGISLEGKMIFTRDHVNEKFYGMKVHPQSLLYGDVPTPPAAQPLYDALKRCRVYTNNYYGGSSSGIMSTSTRRILARNLSMSDDSF